MTLRKFVFISTLVSKHISNLIFFFRKSTKDNNISSVYKSIIHEDSLDIKNVSFISFSPVVFFVFFLSFIIENFFG